MMEVASQYIEPNLDLSTAHSHIALESAIRAIESDNSVHPYNHSQWLDINALGHIQTVATLRDLIRNDSFELDLNISPKEGVDYETPYGRDVLRKLYRTPLYMIQSEKGWIVFDVMVAANIDMLK